MPLTLLWLIPLGFAIGFVGTLIGAGGGFILMPILLYLYPEESPELLTAISLAVVCANATSGSWAYARMKRIDYRAGALFTLAALPGAAIGAYAVSYIPRRIFDPLLGGFLVVGCLLLLFKSRKVAAPRPGSEPGENGAPHEYNKPAGTALSAVVGFLSSILGIGGGIIHVPALVYLLGFPAHVATATSHFVLMFTALVATGIHLADGSLRPGLTRAGLLAIGVVVGAQLGAKASKRVNGTWIIRCLAIALGTVGLRIIQRTLAG